MLNKCCSCKCLCKDKDFCLNEEDEHILRFVRAETGLSDEVHQVNVWILRGLEVKVALCNINKLSLFNCDGTDCAGDLHWQLVLYREHMNHHRL